MELKHLGHDVHYGTASECEFRHVKDFIRFKDPSGTSIEAVVRPEIAGRRYFGSRDAGITSFSHVGLYSRDTVRDEAFWTRVCNARVKVIELVTCRYFASTQSTTPSRSYLPLATEFNTSITRSSGARDDIMRSDSLLQEHGVPIVFGPGVILLPARDFSILKVPMALCSNIRWE